MMPIAMLSLIIVVTPSTYLFLFSGLTFHHEIKLYTGVQRLLPHTILHEKIVYTYREVHTIC